MCSSASLVAVSTRASCYWARSGFRKSKTRLGHHRCACSSAASTAMMSPYNWLRTAPTSRCSLYGGEGGIRTLDELSTHTPLAGERLQPLGHLSGGGNCSTGEPVLGRRIGLLEHAGRDAGTAAHIDARDRDLGNEWWTFRIQNTLNTNSNLIRIWVEREGLFAATSRSDTSPVAAPSCQSLAGGSNRSNAEWIARTASSR